MKIKHLMWIVLCALFIGAIVLINLSAPVKRREDPMDLIDPPPQVQYEQEQPAVPEYTTNDDGSYQLVVGANPSLGRKQIFSPPTNSVEITGGEAQLQLLKEQAKKARQTVQK